MEEKKQHISEWLEKLQRESWNLELLVSGFSIFLLMQTYEVLIDGIHYVNLHVSSNGLTDQLIRSFILIMLLVSFVLTFNLILHVFLRGFWIGAVGLRSVQDKIDLDEFGYSDFFTKKLKKKVPTLDVMLERLDTLSSVIFSFTFLIVFMFISLFLFFAISMLFGYVVNMLLDFIENESIKGVLEFFREIVFVILLVSGLIYLIDTLSMGFFKKYKWLSKIYYPIYVFFGWITMSGIYRSIYYSLISRFSKNKIRIALFLYLIGIFILPFQKFDQYIFYPDNSDDLEISSRAYDDIRDEDSAIRTVSIPSKIIKESFLPLFIRYNVRYNEILKKTCEGIEFKKTEGWNSGIYIGKDGVSFSDPYFEEDDPEKLLNCLVDFYDVFIDSTAIKIDPYFYTHPNKEEKGIYTLIDIKDLSRGKHQILVKRKDTNDDDEIVEKVYSEIPFWKE